MHDPTTTQLAVKNKSAAGNPAKEGGPKTWKPKPEILSYASMQTHNSFIIEKGFATKQVRTEAALLRLRRGPGPRPRPPDLMEPLIRSPADLTTEPRAAVRRNMGGRPQSRTGIEAAPDRGFRSPRPGRVQDFRVRFCFLTEPSIYKIFIVWQRTTAAWKSILPDLNNRPPKTSLRRQALDQISL
jgi:hypothetical protein